MKRSFTAMNSLSEDKRLIALLDRLHTLSDSQENIARAYLAGAGARGFPLARHLDTDGAARLRAGAIVVTDNIARRRSDYREFLAYVSDPANGFSTMTLPFEGGLEMSVKLASP
jgi:hypothetical protein